MGYLPQSCEVKRLFHTHFSEATPPLALRFESQSRSPPDRQAELDVTTMLLVSLDMSRMQSYRYTTLRQMGQSQLDQVSCAVPRERYSCSFLGEVYRELEALEEPNS